MTPPDNRALFLVARGEQPLLQDLRALFGEYGWVRVIEDRRREGVLLPREGRRGTPYLGPAGAPGAGGSTSRSARR